MKKTKNEWYKVILDRIEKKDNDCWEYNFQKDRNGYGHIHFGGKYGSYIFTHRLVFEIVNNVTLSIKDFICHNCDNPSCCNPDHLFLGNAKDNMIDMKNKNRNYITYGERSGMHKLTTEEILRIREDKRSLRIIANEYGVVKSTISIIKNRKSRKYE